MNKNRALWIVLVLVLLAFCCCMTLLAGVLVIRNVSRGVDWLNWSRIERTEQVAQTIQVQAPVTLVIDVPVGDIQIRGGSDGDVSVQATKHAWGQDSAAAQRVLDDIDVQIEQLGNQVRVTATGLTWADGSSGAPRSPRVDLVISAPTQTALQITSNVGSVDAADLHGDITITADVGSVTLRDVTPIGMLRVDSRVAAIQLSAQLAADATYRLTSDIGRVLVQLPEDSAFNIDARSDIGNVNLGFPLLGRSSRDNFIGKEVTGDVGSTPSARLILRSRVGDITIQAGQ